MGILNLGGSGDSDEFDEYYYDDEHVEYLESDDEGAVSGTRSKRLIAMALAGFVAVAGIAFGAKVVINSGGSIEYGQGFKQTVSCQNQQLTVTPFAGFINQANGGFFSLDSIYIEGLTDNCKGVDFIVKVYQDTQTAALGVTDSATDVAKTQYMDYYSTRFWYQDSGTVTKRSNAYTDIEVATDTSTGTTDTSGSLQITFDPDVVTDFANAGQVYKITIETAIHNGTKD